MYYADPAVITGFFIAAGLFGGAWGLAWRAEVASRRRLVAQTAQVASRPMQFTVIEGSGTTTSDAPYLENCGMMARAA